MVVSGYWTSNAQGCKLRMARGQERDNGAGEVAPRAMELNEASRSFDFAGQITPVVAGQTEKGAEDGPRKSDGGERLV